MVGNVVTAAERRCRRRAASGPVIAVQRTVQNWIERCATDVRLPRRIALVVRNSGGPTRFRTSPHSRGFRRARVADPGASRKNLCSDGASVVLWYVACSPSALRLLRCIMSIRKSIAAPSPRQSPAPAPPLSPDLDVVKKSKGPVMTVLDEFYKVGPGPSSSHTMGPMRITYDFYQRCARAAAGSTREGDRASRSICSAA